MQHHIAYCPPRKWRTALYPGHCRSLREHRQCASSPCATFAGHRARWHTMPKAYRQKALHRSRNAYSANSLRFRILYLFLLWSRLSQRRTGPVPRDYPTAALCSPAHSRVCCINRSYKEPVYFSEKEWQRLNAPFPFHALPLFCRLRGALHWRESSSPCRNGTRRQSSPGSIAPALCVVRAPSSGQYPVSLNNPLFNSIVLSIIRLAEYLIFVITHVFCSFWRIF